MNLLVLGSDGFIGYHLISSLLQDKRFDDFNIIGIDTNNQCTIKISKNK